MRTLIISPFFHPHKGGSQRYIEELYSHLMKTDKSVKVDVICYNTTNSPEKEKYGPFQIYRVGCWQILPGQFALPNYIALIKILRKLTKNNKYDFVASNTRFFESSWWAPIFAKIINTKSILIDHCAYHPVHASKFVRIVAKYIDKIISPLICRLYNRVIATNEATLQFLNNLGVTNTLKIYGGVDVKYFHKLRVNTKRHVPHLKKSFSNNDIIITFLGRMIPSKGVALLFDASKKLLANDPHLHFVYAGEGDMANKLSKQKYNNSYFLGELEKEEVLNLLSSTDILVHPSMHHEGFPNVLLEAGAMGLPVLATDKGGTREIIENNQTGIIIEPTAISIQKALEDLIQHPSKRELLAAHLREKVNKLFNWNDIAKDFQKVLVDIRLYSF